MGSRHNILAFGAALLMAGSAVLAAEPVKIGIFAEMTGSNAGYGKEAIVGATLAVEEINRAGGVLGRPLEIVVEDNQSTNPGSEVAVSKLLRAGDVRAILTTVRSTQILAVMPSIAKAGIPTFAFGTTYALTHVNNPWIFRIPPHDGYLAKAMADFGVNSLKKKRWAIVHSEESFGIAAKDDLVRELNALGVAPVLVSGVGYSAQNLTPAVLAVGNAAPEIVAILLARTEASGQFAKQLREAGTDSVLIGGQGLSSKAATQVAGSALHDSYSTTPYVVEATEQSRAFAKKYRERTGGEPDQRASWTYDAVHLLAQAIGIAGSAETEAIRKGLHAIRGYNGAAGTYTFDQNGDGQHGFKIVKNNKGKAVIIKNVSYLAK